MKSKLVGDFNPFEKYVRQVGSFPHVVPVTIKNIWNHQLEIWNTFLNKLYQVAVESQRAKSHKLEQTVSIRKKNTLAS